VSDPISFDSQSPRYGLPLLFSGQSQKEFYVNEAHTIVDSLLHMAIEGSSAAPPASPTDGTNWLVATAATGDWVGQDGKLACRQAGAWIFVTAKDGLSVLNRTNGQILRFFGSWKSASAVAGPSGGTTIDSEARAAINQIVLALRAAGVLTAS